MRGHDRGDHAGQHFRPGFVGILDEIRILFDETGIEAGGAKLRMFQNPQIIGNRRFDAEQSHIAQRALTALDHVFPGHRANDDFRHHGIVKRRNFVTGVNRGIGAHARAARRVIARNAAETRQKIVFRVFGVDTELNGKAAPDNFFLLEAQWQTRGHANLFLDDVDAGDRFGDGVLDLHARVHFHEIKTAAIVEQKLHRTGVGVTDRFRGNHRETADILALCFVKLWRRCNFDQFLITALNRAIALVKMNYIAVMISQYLHFDMLRIDDAFFQKHIGAAEGFGRFGNHPGVI
jgi:hypothetical protein